ncbi:transcriptional regulator, IclR family [Pseudovibrio denitrificans]|uniref:Transcriptional regulator, IclR family n=1 Tax=Pseudovibrio denitrificans TaxID=258256 RepID=A0A1I7D3T7_9HYPH|nr:IclR family transcriptional regulator [Pseudovibrio denitrificans]SFU06291.1 transcriptional regulator, IclR family [Pseudovibrio denitrificans]
MKAPVQGTQSFSRTIHLLNLISQAKAPPSLPQLKEISGLTRPTLYRLLASLEAEGLIEQRGDQRYQLGVRLVSLARKALAENDIRSLAKDALLHLRNQTGETVHLAVPSRDELIYIDKIECEETVRMASTIGTRVPMHSSGVGKAYLGAMNPEEAEALIQQLDMAKITSFTNTDRTVLSAVIHKVREAGYVFDDQENEEGIVCYGAAILDEMGKPAAAISVSIPLYRHTKSEEHYVKPLLACIANISQRLGYRPS